MTIWIILAFVVFPILFLMLISRYFDNKKFNQQKLRDKLLQEANPDNWHIMKRVKCPDCGNQAEIIGGGHSGDKVRCRAKCGKEGFFDGLYIVW